MGLLGGKREKGGESISGGERRRKALKRLHSFWGGVGAVWLKTMEKKGSTLTYKKLLLGGMNTKKKREDSVNTGKDHGRVEKAPVEQAETAHCTTRSCLCGSIK